MHVGGTGRAPNAIKCCERASPHTLQLQTVLDTSRHRRQQYATRAFRTSLARAYQGRISLAILTNGHRPYNILINLFDTQCNLFMRVEVARHTQVPRAESPPSSRIYITGIFIQLSQLTEYKHRINYSLIYTHKTFALRRYGVEINLFR